MKKLHGKFFVAMVLTVSVFLGSVPVMAESAQAIDVVFGRVKLVVNGQAVDKDTLLYDGVTYVPLRDAAEALEMEVFFDSSSSTAYIDPPGTNRGPSETPAPEEPGLSETDPADIEYASDLYFETKLEAMVDRWDAATYDAEIENDAGNFAYLEGYIVALCGILEEYAPYAESDPNLAVAVYLETSQATAKFRDELSVDYDTGNLAEYPEFDSIYMHYIEIINYFSNIFAHEASLITDKDPENTAGSVDMIEAYWDNCWEVANQLGLEGAQWGMPLGECLYRFTD